MDYGVGKELNFGADISCLILGVLLFIPAYLFYFRKKQYSIYRLLVLLALFIYLVAVVGTTLSPIPLNYAAMKYLQMGYAQKALWNLIPLVSTDFSLAQFQLNIIMFIPFGILWPFYHHKWNIKFTTISTLLFTLGIEISQLLMSIGFKANYWFFDVDDLIANFIVIR